MIPENMRRVTKDEFWKAVLAETRNIHPRSEPDYTEWTVVGTRQVWGWTSYGYKFPANRHDPKTEPEVFALTA